MFYSIFGGAKGFRVTPMQQNPALLWAGHQRVGVGVSGTLLNCIVNVVGVLFFETLHRDDQKTNF